MPQSYLDNMLVTKLVIQAFAAIAAAQDENSLVRPLGEHYSDCCKLIAVVNIGDFIQ